MRNRCFNRLLKFRLERVELTIYLGVRSTTVIDFRDAALDVDTAFDCAQDLVAGSENSLEQAELVSEQLKDSSVRCADPCLGGSRLLVMALAVTMATTNSLFYSLRVPREVIVDHERAKLKV